MDLRYDLAVTEIRGLISRLFGREKDIKPTLLPLRLPVWGDINAGSIIQINGDSVEVMSPVITADRVSLTMKANVLD